MPSDRIIGILHLSNYKDYFEHVEGAPFTHLHKSAKELSMAPALLPATPLHHQTVRLRGVALFLPVLHCLVRAAHCGYFISVG